jgi:hypothetical protein
MLTDKAALAKIEQLKILIAEAKTSGDNSEVVSTLLQLLAYAKKVLGHNDNEI